MNVSPRVVREMFEIARIGGGFDRAQVLAGLHGDDRARADAGGGVSWDAFVGLLDHLYNLVERDPERMRGVGFAAVTVSSQGFFQRLALNGVSLRVLYEAERWNATANFPHLVQKMEFPQRDLMRITGIIPARYLPCESIHYIMQGSLRAMPQIVGLGPAVIEESVVTPDRSVTLFRIPRKEPLGRRLLGRARAALHARETLKLYETQRAEIADGVLALERASAELRGVLEALPDPAFLLRDGTVVWANRASVRALGYASADAVVGVAFAEHVHGADRARATDHVENTPPSSTSEAPPLAPARLLTCAGEEIPTELVVGETVTFEGAPARLVVARDVSERMSMQSRLVTANRLASVGMLAAAVAHEINNPLSYVLWNLDTLDRAIASPAARPLRESSDARDALVVVREGVERVRSVVRDLRTLAHPDERAVEPVNVHEALESTLSLMAKHLNERTNVIREYAPALPPVRANRARLGQVFLNLVTNAVASMEGRSRDESSLVLRTRAYEGDRVAIEIADTGHGVPPEHAERIFEPFFTTKPSGRGTGLGLAICQRIATDLGGDIVLARTSERGTTFRILLPAEA